MTNLKDKAKTLEEIKNWTLESFREYNENPNAPQPYNQKYVTRSNLKWVLLSDAETEIQQLQKRLDEQIRLGNVIVGRNIDLKDQVEAAKRQWYNQIMRNMGCNGFCAECRDTNGVCLFRKEYDEALGETTKC